jgi:hypothetical protein
LNTYKYILILIILLFFFQACGKKGDPLPNKASFLEGTVQYLFDSSMKYGEAYLPS